MKKGCSRKCSGKQVRNVRVFVEKFIKDKYTRIIHNTNIRGYEKYLEKRFCYKLATEKSYFSF